MLTRSERWTCSQEFDEDEGGAPGDDAIAGEGDNDFDDELEEALNIEF